MTPQQHESTAADHCLQLAQAHANSFGDPRDLESQTIAIILATFDLATKGMSVERRNALLRGENE
jgi:hypothetical protein